jgi:anti-sigma factor RsiW
MTSPHVLESLPFWIEGDLDPAAMTAVEAHLDQCPPCREAAGQLRTSQAWLREALASPFGAEDRARLHHQVMERIRAERTPKPLLRPALLAACAASLLLAALVWRLERKSPASLPLASTSEVPEGPLAAGPQPRPTAPVAAPAPRLARHRPSQPAEDPAPGEPARFEFQTSDPTVRIIWLAQARPLPAAIPPLQEEP